MTIITIEDLAARLGPGQAVAAIDPGTKTIGLAVSDRGLSFAHPRAVIMRTKFSVDAAALMAALKRDEIAALAIGLPVNMDGSEGPRAQASRAFARNLQRLTPMPLLFWDERLSTVAVERTLIEMDFSRKKRETKIDSAAAAFILQGVLDRLRHLRRAEQESDAP